MGNFHDKWLEFWDDSQAEEEEHEGTGEPVIMDQDDPNNPMRRGAATATYSNH